MLIYNVTINIENDIELEWLQWMQKEHIPAMIATGKFEKALMTKVRIDEEMGGVTYSVQYGCPSEQHLQEYYDHDAERLRAQSNKFARKFVAFRTELEVISQH